MDHATTGDGLVAALQVIAIMVAEQRSLGELAHVMERVPQVLESIKLPARRPLEEMPELALRIGAAEKKLGRDGRVLVRWSGTEAKLRLMVEGPDPKVLQALVEDMADAARRDTAP
jgi:phosphoglucosamine mutase